ncbi:unnamed protein product, partial [Polarella glacialis]
MWWAAAAGRVATAAPPSPGSSRAALCGGPAAGVVAAASRLQLGGAAGHLPYFGLRGRAAQPSSWPGARAAAGVSAGLALRAAARARGSSSAGAGAAATATAEEISDALASIRTEEPVLERYLDTATEPWQTDYRELQPLTDADGKKDSMKALAAYLEKGDLKEVSYRLRKFGDKRHFALVACDVFGSGFVVGTGFGSSEELAKQLAATQALERLAFPQLVVCFFDDPSDLMALGIPDWLEGWREYLKSEAPRTDSHLNQANNEYTEEELRVATKDFDAACMLGSGSFGMVYRGAMNDGTEVAIKVLQIPEEGGFEDEVKVLSRFRHPNLVILMGFARHATTGWRSLIYEFLAGGDLSNRLLRSRQQKESFEGRQRVSVALDAACGLSHLHNMSPRAFHRDIKSPNILLDKNGTAKMADFGLSCVSKETQYQVLRVGGTVGYACPEYIRTGLITEGSEVYSFGMVLLELLTGAPPAVRRPDRPGAFAFLSDHLQGSPAKVQQMLDPSAHFSPNGSQALTVVAFRCTGPRPPERPLFKLLVEELRQLLLLSQESDDDSPVRGAAQTPKFGQGECGGFTPAAPPAAPSPFPNLAVYAQNPLPAPPPAAAASTWQP